MTTCRNIVYVVDQDQGCREAVARRLSTAGYDVQPFGEPNAFLTFERPTVPSCLILDLDLPGMTSLDLLTIMKGDSALPVIFLTGFRDTPGTASAMLGSAEFLSKPVGEDELLPAIAAALRRAESQLADAQALSQVRRNYESLTRREQEVLPYVVRGLLNKQTAYTLGTSEITIRIHRANIMRKMHADSLADLVRMAYRLGIPGDSVRGLL